MSLELESSIIELLSKILLARNRGTDLEDIVFGSQDSIIKRFCISWQRMQALEEGMVTAAYWLGEGVPIRV